MENQTGEKGSAAPVRKGLRNRRKRAAEKGQERPPRRRVGSTLEGRARKAKLTGSDPVCAKLHLTDVSLFADDFPEYAYSQKVESRDGLQSLVRLIEEVGQPRPIVVWQGLVIDSHEVYLACKARRMDKIVCIVRDELTEVEAKLIVLSSALSRPSIGREMQKEARKELHRIRTEEASISQPVGAFLYVDDFYDVGAKVKPRMSDLARDAERLPVYE